jgi:hypothetical protein
MWLRPKPDDFAAIRSTVSDLGAYPGKLTPDAHSTCHVWPHREFKGEPELATYTCDMPPGKTMAEIKPEYTRLRAELQACYPDVVFKDQSSVNDATHYESWVATGHTANVWVRLRAIDKTFMIKAGGDVINEEAKQKPAMLILEIKAI